MWLESLEFQLEIMHEKVFVVSSIAVVFDTSAFCQVSYCIVCKSLIFPVMYC